MIGQYFFDIHITYPHIILMCLFGVINNYFNAKIACFPVSTNYLMEFDEYFDE